MLSVSFFSPVLLFFLFLLYHIFCFSGTFNQRFPNNSCYLLSGTGCIVEPRVMQYRFKHILKELKLSDVSFHSLRHLFATNCIAIGVDVKSLSEILGHSGVEITLNRYVHSSMERKAEYMKSVSALFSVA